MKLNFSSILVLIALMSASLTTFSSAAAEPFIELAPTISLGKGSQANLQLLGGTTWKVSDEVGLGFGTGVISSFKFNATPSIPLFFRSKFDFGSGNIIPFITFDTGYNFNIDDIDYSSILLAPTVGFRTHGFCLGVGYLASIATKGEANVGHNLAFRLGYQFGNSSRARMRTPEFIKRSQVKIELAYAHDFNDKEYYSRYEFVSHLGTAASAKLIWLFRLTDGLQLGIGSGFETTLYKVVDRMDDDERTSLGAVPIIPAFIRPQYNIHVGDSEVVPYVACDLGYKFDVGYDTEAEFDGLMVEPQIGVAYKRLSLGIGGNLVKYKINDYELTSKTTFVPKVTLGVTFN